MASGRKLTEPYIGSVPDSPANLINGSGVKSSRLSFTSHEASITEEADEDYLSEGAVEDDAMHSPRPSSSNETLINPIRRVSKPATSENTPLLPQSANLRRCSSDRFDLKPASDDSSGEDRPAQMTKGEITVLVKYTIPIWLTHLLENSLVMATVIAVGHLGKTELAASSIASMTGNVTALSIIHGMVAALDTLCPQAYTSARPKTTSLYALRTAGILCVLLIPQTLFFWNATPVLLFLRQDPEVAYLAGKYLKILSFGLPGYAAYEVVRRWLQSQGLMSPPTAVVFLVAPLNILLNYLLVWDQRIGIGFVGAPLASALSMDLMGGLLLVYCWLYAPRDAWGGFTRAALRGWGQNIRLGLAGTAMVASEWWSWELVGLASSQLGTTALAAQSCLLVTSGVTYQASFAASAAAAVRIGNLLGAHLPKRARLSSRVALALGLLIGVFNSLVLLVYRNHLGKVFTSDPDVISDIASILPLVALFQVFDSVCGVGGGVLRGAGRSPPAAILNIASYYVIGLPLGLVLTFLPRFNLGLYGLWIGLTVALGVNCIAFSAYVLYLNFELEADNAAERAAEAALSEASMAAPPIKPP